MALIEAFSRCCLTRKASAVLELWAFSTTLDILMTERQACATVSPSLSVLSVTLCSWDEEAGDFSVGLCLYWPFSSWDLCFLGRSVSVDLAFFGVSSLVPFSSRGSMTATLGSVGVTFKFSSWSARDSSTAGSGTTRFCMDPNWCVVTSTSDLPRGVYGAVKRISDSYLMVALLIPVHVGQESCGGMRTRLSSRWSRRRAIKVEVGPSLATRSTVLSAGSMHIAATPMTLVPPSLCCSPVSDRMCEASVETGVK